MMRRNPFTPSFDKLPRTIPIFPLPGAVVMPATQLPLNIFESRYLNMVLDALAESRMIGMVQPDPSLGGGAVYATGTAGRITSFSETDDGRFLVVLTGVCRFHIAEEIPTTRGYRRVVADWSRFAVDYGSEPQTEVERTRLIELLRAYAESQKMEIGWDGLKAAESHLLINVLISNLPFEVPDKQSLIEAITLTERAHLLVGLLEMAINHSAALTQLRH
jgi:Lon protease-like protein